MSCRIKNEQGEMEVRAPNGAPSSLPAIANFTLSNDKEFSDSFKGTHEEKVNQLVGYYNSLENVPKDENGENIIPLTTLTRKDTRDSLNALWKILSKAGVKKENFDTFKQDHEARTNTPLNVKGISDPLNKMVSWMKGDLKTATEEMVHMLGNMMYDDPTYQRMLEIVVGTPVYNRIYKEYKDLGYSDELIAKEAVDKIIRDVILGEKPSITKRFLNSIKRFLSKVKRVFDPRVEELNELANSLKTMLLTDQIKVKEIKGSRQWRLDDSSSPFVLGTVLKNFLDKLEADIKNEKDDTMKFKKDKIVEAFYDSYAKGSYANASKQAFNEVDKIYDRALTVLQELDKEESTPEAKLSALRRSKELIELVQDFISEFGDKIDERANTKSAFPSDIEDAYNRLLRKEKKFSKDYEESQLLLAEQVLSPFEKLSQYFKEGDFKSLMKEAVDIGSISSYLYSLSDVADGVLQFMDLYVKQVRDRVMQKVTKDHQDLLRLRSKITNYDDGKFIQKHDGKITRYFVNKEGINFVAFAEKRKEAFQKLVDKYGLPKNDGTQEGKEKWEKWKKKNPEKLNKYIEAKEKWIRDNQEADPNLENIIFTKINKIISSLYSTNDKNLAKTLLKAVKDKNYYVDKNFERNFASDYQLANNLSEDKREQIEDIAYSLKFFLLENSVFVGKKNYFTGKLAVPKASLYKDNSYEKLSKEEQAYLDKVFEIKRKGTSLGLSAEQVYKIPQQRKTTAERLGKADFKGIWTGVKEQFQFNEDESEYGETNSNNRYSGLRSIPIFFVKEIENIEDMSTDIMMLVSSFNQMATHYTEMKKVEATILNAEEILNNRDVLNEKSNEKTGAKGGNSAALFSAYVDTNVYGMRKLDEGYLGKIIDTINTYTRNLGLSLASNSAIATTLQNFSTLLQQRIPGVFSEGTYKKAKAFYTANLGASIKGYENPMVDDKLSALNRLFNIEDSFLHSVLRNSASENKAIKIGMSAGYALNGIGEHYGAFMSSLMTLEDIKVIKDGQEMSLLDAVEYREYEAFIPDNVTLSNGKPINTFYVREDISKTNKRLFGIYNDIDSARLQRSAMGRSLLTFRRFIISPGLRRWKKKRFVLSESLMQDEMKAYEGFYMTMFRTTKDHILWAKDQKKLFNTSEWKKAWDKLPAEEKLNWKRGVVEIGTVVGALGIFMLLAQAFDSDDEDERYWLVNFAKYQMRRHATEMGFFFNPAETLNILRNPAAPLSTLSKLLKVLPSSIDMTQFLTEGDPFERYNDGTYKAPKKIGDMIPVFKGIRNTVEVEEGLKFYDR